MFQHAQILTFSHQISMKFQCFFKTLSWTSFFSTFWRHDANLYINISAPPAVTKNVTLSGSRWGDASVSRAVRVKIAKFAKGRLRWTFHFWTQKVR